MTELDEKRAFLEDADAEITRMSLRLTALKRARRELRMEIGLLAARTIPLKPRSKRRTALAVRAVKVARAKAKGISRQVLAAELGVGVKQVDALVRRGRGLLA